MRRPTAYTPPAEHLEIIQVEILRGAYCPPPLTNVTWSPVAGAFVVRERMPAHVIGRGLGAFALWFLATLGLWALLRMGGHA